METLWKAAFAVGGVAAIGAFVLWSLYQRWLRLPVFATLTPEQTFILMLVFLSLVFACALAMIIAFVRLGGKTNTANPSERISTTEQETIHLPSMHDIRKYDPRINELEERAREGPIASHAPSPMSSRKVLSWLLFLVVLMVLAIGYVIYG